MIRFILLFLFCSLGGIFTANAAETDAQVEAMLQKAAAQDTPVQEADALFSQAAKSRPQDGTIYQSWGLFYESHHDFAKAEEKYKQYSRLDPQSYIPLARIGAMEQKQGHYRESNDYFTKAEAIHSTVGMLDMHCNNFMQLRQWREAVSECTQAIAMDQERFAKLDEYAYNLRSQAYKAMGKDDLAKQDQSVIAREEKKDDDHKKRNGMLLLAVVALVLLFLPFQSALLNLYVYHNKRPILYSIGWMFIPIVFIAGGATLFVPQLTPDVTFSIITLCALMGWVQMGTYTAFGINGDAFRELIFRILKELNLEWKENDISSVRSANSWLRRNTLIELTGVNLRIVISNMRRNVAIRFGRGVDSNAKEARQQIFQAINRHFAEDQFNIRYDISGLLYAVATAALPLVIILFVIQRVL